MRQQSSEYPERTWQPAPQYWSVVPQKPKLEQQKPGAQKNWSPGAPHEPSVESVSRGGCVVVDVEDEVLVDVCVWVDEDVEEDVDVEV